MVEVKEGEGYDPQESYSAEMDAPRRRRYMAIGEPGEGLHCRELHSFSAQDTRHEKALLFCSVSQNAFPEFLVCGVVPIFDDQKDWKLVVYIR